MHLSGPSSDTHQSIKAFWEISLKVFCTITDASACVSDLLYFCDLDFLTLPVAWRTLHFVLLTIPGSLQFCIRFALETKKASWLFFSQISCSTFEAFLFHMCFVTLHTLHTASYTHWEIVCVVITPQDFVYFSSIASSWKTFDNLCSQSVRFIFTNFACRWKAA